MFKSLFEKISLTKKRTIEPKSRPIKNKNQYFSFCTQKSLLLWDRYVKAKQLPIMNLDKRNVIIDKVPNSPDGDIITNRYANNKNRLILIFSIFFFKNEEILNINSLEKYENKAKEVTINIDNLSSISGRKYEQR